MSVETTVRLQDTAAAPRAHPAVLVAVSVWRLVIVGCAFVGFWEAVRINFANVAYLSQLSSFVTGVAYLVLLLYPLFVAGRRHEPRGGWIRGALALLLILVSGTFATLMAGTYDDVAGLLEHLVTPLLVVVDWLVVGRNQGTVRWWHPLTWLALPLAYLAFYLGYFSVHQQPLYSFLDPASPSFAVMVVSFLVSLLLVGYLMYGIAKLRALVLPPQR